MSQFIELYIAYFNRAPDAIGLGFWGTAFANGTTLEETATLFIDQEETRATYPEGTASDVFVTSVYQNVLGRQSDQAGFDFWVGVLNSGSVGRDQFILELLRGAKADPPAEADQAFIDQQLADRAFLTTKTDLGTYFAVTRGMSDVANASAAMALFDGTTDGLNAAISATDSFYQDALDPVTGEFLLQVVGVLDNPFADPPSAPPLPAVAAADDVVTVTEDTPFQINVLSNDTGALSVIEFTTPTNGTVELVQTQGGQFLYTPSADYVGEDSFTYVAGDGLGQTVSATVSITVIEDDVPATVAEARAISLDDTVMSEIEGPLDIDIFKVELSSVGTYAVRLTGPAADAAFAYVAASDGTVRAVAGQDDTLFFSADTGQTELLIGIAAEGFDPANAGYNLDVSEIFPPDDLLNSEETIMYADLSGDGIWSTSENGQNTLTRIDQEGDLDWIGLYLSAGQQVRIDLTSTGSTPIDPDLIIRNSDGTLAAQSNATGSESFEFSSSVAGPYYIEVSAFGTTSTVGTYDLTVTEIV